MKNLLITFLLISCASPKVVPVEPNSDRLEELQESQAARIEKAIEIADTKQTWLVSESCDSMMWSAKFGTMLDGYFDYGLAANGITSGRYFRRPSQDCFALGHSGSSWSRDMSISLLINLYSQRDLEAIERHIAYGEANGWIMGEGLKSRTVYSPFLISLWYKTAKKLGHDYHKVEIPNIWTKGLIDFQAHLQMLAIYHLGELDDAINETMLARVNEHSSRVPSSIFYEVVRAKYGGDVLHATDLCLGDDLLVGDYVRCDGEPCELAEQIFACGIVTKFIYEAKHGK